MNATRFANDDPSKRAAGYAAVDRCVRDGTCVGLGTGTTAYWAIERVGQRVAQGARITAVATSSETELLCRQRGIPLVAPLDRPIAVAIDGADEVAPDWSLIKGGGGALFREKLIALLAERYVVVVTEQKLVPALGAFALPVEVVPFAECYVREAIAARFGVSAELREHDANPFATDNGNWVVDCRFGTIADPPRLDHALRAIHGVVSTGLFYDVVDDVIVAGADGAVRSAERS